MELLNYLNAHHDWEKKLAAAPYNLKIAREGEYYIISYQQFISDMSLHICQEARGAIFRRAHTGWICVCRGFNKFFNATEPYAATTIMDWDTARVQEKIDGSLIKFYYDRGRWNIATNNTINARNTTINDHTFYELVEKAVDLPKLCARLDPLFTYMFELTTPYNKCVIKYDGYSLWYLGRRSMVNFKEDATPMCLPGVRVPRLFDFHNLSDCIAAAEKMDLNQEGFVVVDQRFNRIKIKGDAYLAAHRLRGNDAPTTKRFIELWQTDSLDDFLAVCPEYQEEGRQVIAQVANLLVAMEDTYAQVQDIVENKDFAIAIVDKSTMEKAYAFARRREKISTAIDFLKNARVQSIVDAIS